VSRVTRIRNGGVAPEFGDPRAGRTSAAAAMSPAKTPYWLLWSTSIVAFMIGMAAFVLWGTGGASTLFDMIVALCT
jgi:hypothetical protein